VSIQSFSVHEKYQKLTKLQNGSKCPTNLVGSNKFTPFVDSVQFLHC
jgi:hypothetical protein